MTKYRNRAIVDAVLIDDILKSAIINWPALPAWVKTEYEAGRFLLGLRHIQTGEKNASAGWWLILREDDGTLQTMHRDYFRKIYEAQDAAGKPAPRDLRSVFLDHGLNENWSCPEAIADDLLKAVAKAGLKVVAADG